MGGRIELAGRIISFAVRRRAETHSDLGEVPAGGCAVFYSFAPSDVSLRVLSTHPDLIRRLVLVKVILGGVEIEHHPDGVPFPHWIGEPDGVLALASARVEVQVRNTGRTPIVGCFVSLAGRAVRL